MKNTLRTATMLVTSLLALAAQASSPVGRWHTIDDKTGETKSVVTIEDAGGVLRGKVSQILRKDADPAAKCGLCKDDRKDQPIAGLELMRGLKKSDTRDNQWDGGTIVEPSTGKVYKVQLTPIEGGKKLEVRGYVGVAWLGRTQTWIRVQ